MKLMTFTVPCYNSAGYMSKCIDSLLKGGDEVEILIIDDGSKDETGAIADRYEREHPGICKAIHQENGGHGEGINQGLRHATGKFFKVVDSDDWVDEKALKRVLSAVRGMKAGEEADLIVFLDLPRLTCLRQAWGRYRRFRGQVRDSAADGCCEKFDLEFFRWLVWDGRSRKRSAQYRSLMARYSAKAVVLKNRAQIQSFLARFPASDPAAL